jgi:hypothetical protein
MTESTSELRAPEEIRTPNLLIRKTRAAAGPGTMQVVLGCGWRRRDARLSSLLSSELSSDLAESKKRILTRDAGSVDYCYVCGDVV